MSDEKSLTKESKVISDAVDLMEVAQHTAVHYAQRAHREGFTFNEPSFDQALQAVIAVYSKRGIPTTEEILTAIREGIGDEMPLGCEVQDAIRSGTRAALFLDKEEVQDAISYGTKAALKTA